MTIQPTSTRSTSPLFDSLAQQRPATSRPLSPIPASSRTVAPGAAPIWMREDSTAPATPPAADRRHRRSVATALPSISTVVSDPISTTQLTDDERAIVSEMGGTVARLILQMLDDDATDTRRR